MFTGIVEGAGEVRRCVRRGRSAYLEVKPTFSAGSLKMGDSVSVNGCCLTVARKGPRWIGLDLSPETLRVTNLGRLDVGSRVNLERAARLSDRIGGHLVQGHVDGIGKIRAVRKNKSDVSIVIGMPRSLRRYMISKGSVTIDGVSMTVNRLRADSFTLVVIPHTLKMTNFPQRKLGDWVNLEVDIIGKYIENFLPRKRRVK